MRSKKWKVKSGFSTLGKSSSTSCPKCPHQMNTIHDTDVTFVLTSSPPQMPASGKSWGPGEKKLNRGEKIKGTKTFSPQNMRFHYKTRLLHRCVRLPQETSDWLASHCPTVDTLGQNRRLSTFVREPARKKQLHPPQHKNYWVYHLDTLDTLDSGCQRII